MAEVDNTLLDLLNSSYPTKAEFINCFIIVFLPFLPCFLLLLCLLPAVVFTLERSKVSAMFIFTTKTTQPRSHSALTFKVFHLAKT